MIIHREGKRIIYVAAILVLLLATISYRLFPPAHWGLYVIYGSLVLLMLWVIWFFRSPDRDLTKKPDAFISPADGKVLTVRDVDENEVFGRRMRQISIFMSPFNVHLNRIPTDGKISQYRYHPGKYLVAWHPKSSRLNERNTIVVETDGGTRYMVRQIAGVVARRIVCYCHEGKEVKQGDELGFIKFGSRVDLFLPLDARVHVKAGDKVKGGVSTLASFSEDTPQS